MPIKDILVQIDAGPASASRLDLAVTLAKQHDAHVIGLCVFDMGRLPDGASRLFDPEDVLALSRLQDQLWEEGRATAERLGEEFNDRLRREELSGEWRSVQGDAAATVSLHARYTDLAVLGQQDPDNPALTQWTTVLEGALMSSGRPILVVPYAGRFHCVGRRALIGWNGEREAARAVHDALPLLDDAETVTVLAIDPKRDNEGRSDQAAADLCRHPARHGLPVTAQETSSDGLDQATILLNYASDLGSDLIVIGGYGHSRMREIVLGGVTRELLQHATVPVLMSH